VEKGMSRKPRSLFLSPRGTALLLLAIACSSSLSSVGAAQPQADGTQNSAPHASEGYLGSEACARCHAGIYKKFSTTAMGRSMSVATPAVLSGTSHSETYTSDRLNRRFEVYSKDGKLYQSEAGLGADGKETFRDEHPISWIVGAGVNGFGPILSKDGYLFQGPLSYYAKPHVWAPSPGYESIDLGFNRSIQPGCIFCHSGRPNPVAASNGKFEDPPFSELAIGCEKCHGPGAAHIEAMHANSRDSSGKSPAIGSLKSSIVNPGRLTPQLADNICMACHQTGDVRVLKPGKTYEDVRPGQPLDDTLSILMVPPTRESPPSEDHVQHYYSMTLSKCYRASSGRMGCVTCHDPHVQPTAAEAPAYFAAKCMTCHTDQSCKLPLAARQKTQPANNCIGCHMPRRDIQVISHSSATNHRIVATPDEPFPDVTFRQTTASLPDLIHLNPAPGKEAVEPPALTLLQAYGELAENKPEYTAAYLKLLSQLEQKEPDVALVQASLGRRDLKSGNFASAVQHLRRASELDPSVATTYADLADALAHQGQANDAIPLIEKSIELDLFNPLTRKMLIVRLIETKQFPKAHQALEDYLAVFPQDDFMRQMLARVDGKTSQP
jgi:Tfp pilus assembly protein PilF